MFEKVNPAHPDKVADRIAGALVDLAYKKVEDPKIAVEVLIGHGKCHIIAETSEHIEDEEVAAAVHRISGQKLVVDYVEVPQDAHLAENQRGHIRCGDNGIFKGMPVTEEAGSLMASGYEKLGTQEAANDMFVTKSVVRRLTPGECELLQGYPKGWTNIGEWVDTKGKKHKDTDGPRYKALGNSIALPFWKWMARRIAAMYERPVTMASLFDGIGGFPLAFESAGGKAVWASEIEEFPIAVTKIRFPEET